jgi:hypothetical protein
MASRRNTTSENLPPMRHLQRSFPAHCMENVLFYHSISAPVHSVHSPLYSYNLTATTQISPAHILAPCVTLCATGIRSQVSCKRGGPDVTPTQNHTAELNSGVRDAECCRAYSIKFSPVMRRWTPESLPTASHNSSMGRHRHLNSPFMNIPETA